MVDFNILQEVSNNSNSLGTTTIEWNHAFLDWILNLTSDRTRQAYKSALRCFFEFCPLSPTDVTQSDILRWRYELENQVGLNGTPFSQTTINLRISALSSFFTFAISRGLRADNPCAGVKRKAINPYGKATFLDGDLGQDFKLLQAVDTATLQGKRDIAILLLFLTTAIRLDAVANLRVNNLRRQGDAVYVSYSNKGGVLVEKRLHSATVQSIDAYLAERTNGLREFPVDAPLFCATMRGKSAARNLGRSAGETPLTGRTIQKLVRKYADKALKKGHGITPHSLRHTAAVNAIQEGASVLEVSKLLRHKNIGVTTIYIQHISDKADEKISKKLDTRYKSINS